MMSTMISSIPGICRGIDVEDEGERLLLVQTRNLDDQSQR